jgi:hypothetical protein
MSTANRRLFSTTARAQKARTTICRNRVLVVFLRRQKRERESALRMREQIMNVTTQTVERGPKEQKLSIYYLGYQFLKKKKLKHLALKASSSTLKYFLTTSEELLEERDERG